MVVIEDKCIIMGLKVYINSENNKLIIWKNTIINASKKQRTLFNPCNGCEIIIGEKCLFSNSVEIHTTDYHKILDDGICTNSPQSIYIGSHCWIGLQSLILKGTTIADNVVVGARSLVNRDVAESNVVVAGSPAKIVKRGVTWDYW